MMDIFLTRDQAWVNVLLLRTASNGSVTLLGDADHETTVPMTALLAASPLIRAMLVDTGLHPSLIGQVVMSLPGMDSKALSYAGDILTKGRANVKDVSRDTIDDVKKVFQMLGVVATLSFSANIVVGGGNIAFLDSEVIEIKQEKDETPNDNKESLSSSDTSYLQGGTYAVEGMDQKDATIKQVRHKVAKNVNVETNCTKLYSNNLLDDSCKTVCKVCQQAIRLSRMRSHTKLTHGLSSQQYKKKYGIYRHHILDPIYFHKCGLCDKDLLLDMDAIYTHCLKSHGGIKMKEYTSRFLEKRDESFDNNDDGEGNVGKAGLFNVGNKIIPSEKKRKKSNGIDAILRQARRRRRSSENEEEFVSMSTPLESLENESCSSSPSRGADTPKSKINNLEEDADAEVNSSKRYENEGADVVS